MPTFLSLLSVALGLLVVLGSVEPVEPTELQNCTFSDNLIAYGTCDPRINELNRYISIYKGRKPPVEVIKNMSVLCEKTSKCLKNLNCKEALEVNAKLTDSCEQLEFLSADVHACLPKFFWMVYENEGCTKEYDYFSRDLSKKRDAYTLGKQCFLDFAKANCSAAARSFLSNRYPKLLNLLTVAPNIGTCEGFHYQLESFQCKPVMMDVDEKAKKVNMDTFKLNDPEILDLISTCRAAENCAKNSCRLGPTFRQISDGCDVFELANTEYLMCARKLKQEKPDLSKYKCLEGHDFHDKSKGPSCERLTGKKDCVKKVMEEMCGSKAVEDYEENVKVAKKVLKC